MSIFQLWFKSTFPCSRFLAHAHRLWLIIVLHTDSLWHVQTLAIARGFISQVPGVTQPLPDRSNHRQGLFHSHPRVKAQYVPKEMTETYKSIALFFSSLPDPILNASMRFDNSSRRRVDFTWPGSHQKEKVCTEIKWLALHQLLWRLPCHSQNSQTQSHSVSEWKTSGTRLLTAFQWGFITTKLLLAVPSPPMLLNYQPLGLCLCFSPPEHTSFIPMPHTEFQCVLPAQPKFLCIYEVFLGWSLLKFPYHSKCIFNMVLCLPCIWLFILLSGFFYAESSLRAGSAFVQPVACPGACMEGTGLTFVNYKDEAELELTDISDLIWGL